MKFTLLLSFGLVREFNISALRPLGVLIQSALPRAGGIIDVDVDVHVSGDAECPVLCQVGGQVPIVLINPS